MYVGRQGSLALAGSLSRRRKTLIQNRGIRSPLASSGTSATLSMRRPYSPIVSDLPCHWVLSMFRWRHGTTGTTSSHVKNLTVQTWWSTMTTSHSSFIEVPSTVYSQCALSLGSTLSFLTFITCYCHYMFHDFRTTTTSWHSIAYYVKNSKAWSNVRLQKHSGNTFM